MRDRPSSTALLIAAAMVILREDPRTASLVRPEAAEFARGCLRAAGSWWRLVLGLARRPFARRILLAIERALIPGLFVHFPLPKLEVREEVTAAVAQGFRQVVVLGAGFDPLCLELLRTDDVRCIEVDRGATQGIKAKVLERWAVRSDRLSLIAADLASERLHRALACAREFDGEAATVVVAEGMLMYLDSSQVDRLLVDLATTCPRARLVFTFMSPDARGNARFRRQSSLVNLLLSLRREPFRWGMCPARLAGFLLARGWALSSITGPEQWARLAHRESADWRAAAAEGEWVAVAEALHGFSARFDRRSRTGAPHSVQTAEAPVG